MGKGGRGVRRDDLEARRGKAWQGKGRREGEETRIGRPARGGQCEHAAQWCVMPTEAARPGSVRFSPGPPANGQYFWIRVQLDVAMWPTAAHQPMNKRERLRLQHAMQRMQYRIPARTFCQSSFSRVPRSCEPAAPDGRQPAPHRSHAKSGRVSPVTQVAGSRPGAAARLLLRVRRTEMRGGKSKYPIRWI